MNIIASFQSASMIFKKNFFFFKDASTVAFLGRAMDEVPIQMYVGVTYDMNSIHRDTTPATATRSLSEGTMFNSEEVASVKQEMFIDPKSRESYPINYVYGFSWSGYAYFLTTQLKHTAADAPKEYITKLVRVCQLAVDYSSYTEIPVDCVKGDTKYNLAQAAYLGHAGFNFANDLGIDENDDVLYAIFTESIDNMPSNKSALCVYSIQTIQDSFEQNMEACHHGQGFTGLDFISPSKRCVFNKHRIDEYFCTINVNSPLGGELPVAAVPDATFDKQLTAVAATQTSGTTVVFVGTNDGCVKKLVVESGNSAVEFDYIEVQENSTVNADMHFDLQETNLYVMTKFHVAKIKVHGDCAVFSDCNKCVGAKDPYCGWCPHYNKCSIGLDCRDEYNSTVSWKNFVRNLKKKFNSFAMIFMERK